MKQRADRTKESGANSPSTRKAEPAKQKRPLLDRIGWSLLAELQRNARLSYAELGRRVGLTTPAVIERMRRMEAVGIITGYHAQIGAAATGTTIMAFVRLQVTTGATAEQVSASIGRHVEVVECHRTTGQDSFFVRVVVPTLDRLAPLIDQLSSCGSTSTWIVLSTPIPPRMVACPMILI